MMIMTSTRAKGQKYVKEAIDIYIACGYRCWKPGNKAHFIGPGKVVSQTQDIMEAFDFLAWSEAEIHYVQVKAQESHSSEARQKIDDLKLPSGTIRVVMMRVSKKKHTFRNWVRRFDQWSKPIDISLKQVLEERGTTP